MKRIKCLVLEGDGNVYLFKDPRRNMRTDILLDTWPLSFSTKGSRDKNPESFR